LKDELPVDQPIFSGDSRLTEQDIGLGRFIGKSNSRDGICEETDDDHEKTTQDLWDAEHDIRHDGPELAKTASGQKIRHRFLQVIKHHAAITKGFNHAREGFKQNHIGSLNSNVAPGPNRDTNISRPERGRVIDAVAGHPDNLVPRLELSHDAQLVLGRGARKDDFLVLGQLGPLLLVEGDELRTAEDDCAACAVSVFAYLVLSERGVEGGDAVEGFDGVDTGVGDDVAFSCNCLRRERKVSGDLSLSVLVT
jgi:hypothetical protein